jgi:hypothetical protein
MTNAAPLLNTPNDPQAWDRYTFDVAQNVRDIRYAIFKQRSINLPDYQLWPMPVSRTDWLQRLSQAVGDITSVLGIQAVDVELVDLDDDHARQGWTFSVWQELNSARLALKI